MYLPFTWHRLDTKGVGFMILNYSSFMGLLKEHYLSTTTAEELARGLLEVVTGDTSNPNFVDSTYLSRIWKGEREIAKDIRDWVENAHRKKQIYEYFNDVIVCDLISSLKDDFYSRLSMLISNDETISDKKKAKLKTTFESGNESKYLADVFMYALSKPNKGYVTKLGFDDGALFEEVDQRCPICNTPLFKKLSDRTRFFFSVTKIYPESIPSSREADFTNLHDKPSDPEDKINKICLCNFCSSNYQFNPTTDTYDFLYRFKQRAVKNKGINAAASTVLDDEIKKILESLKECDAEADSFKKLRMKPLKIVNKIKPDNRLLIKAIKDDNDAYYNFIKENLSQMDGYKISFRKIAHEVADCFLNLLEVTDDQDEIYNALTQWILDTQMLPESYRNAAHIVISFFVQNCEVFDEITE